MVKSFFLLYKRAKTLYDEGKIKLQDIKEEQEKTTYWFQANGHTVALEISKVPNTRLWLRHWKCGCEHFSLWQDKTQCKHIVACEYYLTNGGYNEKETNRS